MIPVDSVTQLHKKKSRAYIAKCLRDSDNAINAICAPLVPRTSAGTATNTKLLEAERSLHTRHSPLDAAATSSASERNIHEKCGFAYFCCGN